MTDPIRATDVGTSAKSFGDVIGPLRRRQRGLNAMRCCTIGLFAGLIAAVALTLLAWLVPSELERSLVQWCIAAVAAGAALGAVAGALIPIADLRLARAIDRAAQSEDRFASALQLAHHHRQERAQLIASDAITRVGRTAPSAALPLRLPRVARWSAVPLLVLCTLFVILPTRSTVEAAAPAPEISSEEWESLHDELARELKNLPKPETPEEEEMRKMLEELSKLIQQNPEKRDVLKEIARISEKVEKTRQSLSTRDLNMKDAANAIARSEALKQFAATLNQGNYDKAANELQKLAEQMDSGEVSPDAQEFESMSQDLERLAKELASHDEMQKSAQECSKCAGSMNKKQLSDALKRMAQQMKSNCNGMCKGDACRRTSNLLKNLQCRMGQCKGGKCAGQGAGLCQKPGAKPGGLRAGWGTAAQWDGGDLAKTGEDRTPDLANDIERDGEHSSFKIVSPDERAQSGKSYEELYAEFVQKTEADLDLESVPVAYREFLRKYFNSIRPTETSAPEPAGSANN